jgi:hypothetical protein
MALDLTTGERDFVEEVDPLKDAPTFGGIA